MRAERLNSIQEFKKLKYRLVPDKDYMIPCVVIPAGTCGQASGANDLIRIAKRELISKKLLNKINLRITGCHGFCEMEPSVLIEPFRTFYPKVKPEGMLKIINAVAEERIEEDLLFMDPETNKRIEKQEDIPFFKNQRRLILSRNEKVDPIRIYNYIENSGYSSLVQVLESFEPQEVIKEVKESGLRGRGGAGFSTGLKWEFLAKSNNGSGSFLVCNADEGDPGAYMDRCVLEGNPHSIIEGMLIGAFATGAGEGVVYVRNEYPLAIKHLIIALRQAREIGLLGNKILGTEFSFDINLVRGAGAFVCGEETALMKSIEGKMGEPRQRPPFPVEKGIYNKPTVINNVETWANIPIIFDIGASGFAKIGTKKNSGTKIFSLVGKIKNTGLVEIPMGICISDIVNNIGGGSSENSQIKAVQTGGPSGGCIPAQKFDTAIDYDSLSKVGSIMGSGGMIVMDKHTCMVDVAKYFMAFLKDESCGKCFTCRKGTQRMYEILDDITRGKGTREHLGLLEELAKVVKDTTMCGLGQTASNPVLSTLRYFREEYLEHIDSKHCPAGVCKDLITFSINDNCTGCQACIKACSSGAIHGEKLKKHTIDPDLCIKCGACRSVCKFDAVEVY
jgi:NADH-quinone oxidoreductase subunit F